MTLNEYQQQAMTTRLESCDNFPYMMLNLVGEVGEFASKVAKALRKKQIVFAPHVGKTFFWNEDAFTDGQFAAWRDELRKEVGDILWQLAGLCDVMGWKLEDVAQENLAKLASRKQRGVIDGDGDNR